jgi:cell filamentation protein
MELHVLDPFGDFQTAGYLRNFQAEKDLEIVKHLEAAAFHEQVRQTLSYLEGAPSLTYEHILQAHRMLFDSVYPWAGQDRQTTAPYLRIVKEGYRELFALPDSIRFAADYALRLASDAAYLRAHPGEIFGYLAHAHPFLEGNGRALLTVYSDMSRRAGFHVVWEQIDKREFLRSLTDELMEHGTSMDTLILRYVRDGVLSLTEIAGGLESNFERQKNI